MTREEAIKKLTRLKNEFLEEYIDFNGTTDAYNMAIEALKQPEIIKCKDCCFYAISKEKRSWCKDMLRRIQPEDFCSHAKRREE